MKKYEPGDEATFYFISIKDDELSERRIHAWTDSKNMLDQYLSFHKCNNMKKHIITKRIEEIMKFVEENLHDEIEVYNIRYKDPDKKRKCKTITIPATGTEMQFVSEECNTFMSSVINYNYLQSAIPYLKNKYQKALNMILTHEVSRSICGGKTSERLQEIEMDQLLVFIKLLPDLFGK